MEGRMAVANLGNDDEEDEDDHDNYGGYESIFEDNEEEGVGNIDKNSSVLFILIFRASDQRWRVLFR